MFACTFAAAPLEPCGQGVVLRLFEGLIGSCQALTFI